MENQNKRYRSADASSQSSRTIRTTASYMHAPKAEPADENESRRKKPKKIRKNRSNENTSAKIPFKKIGIISGAALAAILVLVLMIALFSGSGTYHQMPTVTTPAPTEIPEGAV